MDKGVTRERKAILVLDVGDLFFRKFTNPIPENELNAMTQKANLIIDTFNLMGYDTMRRHENPFSSLVS